MRTFRGVMGFAFSFAVAWVVIFTFVQEPFRASVPLQIFSYQTQSIPIYFYVLGTFVMGLLIGLASTLMTYFRMVARVRKSSREARDLAAENERLRASLNLPADDDPPHGQSNVYLDNDSDVTRE